jgi:hypothetical protein
MSRDARIARVRAVLAAARRLADACDSLGIEARRALPGATGLSAANVELGLTRHLETSVSDADLDKLLSRAGPAPRVHVVLSANVFVGVVRAVALAVAAAPAVIVRPSSREAVLAPLLQRAASEPRAAEPHGNAPRADEPLGALFELSHALSPAPGDVVHVYGRRETIAAIGAQCPPGVTVHGHGPGFGVAIAGSFTSSHAHPSPVDAVNAIAPADLADQAERLSWDIVPFDQRGCMSPRIAFVVARHDDAERFASLLAAALERREKEVPRGRLSAEEERDRALYEQTMRAVGRYEAGASFGVGLDSDPRALVLPPAGRHIHIARVYDVDTIDRLLAPYRSAVTCIGVAEKDANAAVLFATAMGARSLPLGGMQSPPLDGPVDLRGMI